MNKRLLIVTTTPETILTILAGQPQYLSKHFTVAVCSSPGEQLISVNRAENVETYGVSMRRGISPLSDIISIIKMIFVIIRFRPQIIQSYTPKAGLVAMASAWICNVPIRVHTFTGLIFPTSVGIKKQLLIIVDRIITKFATNVIPESEGVKKDLITYKITNKTLQLIGFGNIAGVDIDYYSDKHTDIAARSFVLQKQLGLCDAFVYCFVGRLNKDKGIHELYNAFCRLPDTARLLMVGAIDVSQPLDEGLVYKLKNHPRIHVVGFVHDIRQYLKASDVLVLPSYREGFPNVVLQAMAMNLPVIVTDVSGANEITKHEQNGWVIPIKNEIALYAVMHKAMNTNRADLNKMGALGRALIKERHEKKQHLYRLLAFYNGL